jgi:hypothetical protein
MECIKNIVLKALLNIVIMLVASYSFFSKDCSLHGEILNSQTKEPVPAAIVYIVNDKRLAHADRGGIFALDSIKKRKVRLAVVASGYEPEILKIRPLQDTSTFISVELTPAASILSSVLEKNEIPRLILGRCHDSVTNAPLKNVAIQIYDNKMQTKSDKSGFFSFALHNDSCIHVLAQKDGYSQKRQLVKASVGNIAYIDMRLCPIDYPIDSKQVIKGKVLDSITREPIDSAMIHVLNAAGSKKAGISNKNGEYRIPSINSDRITLIASKMGYCEKVRTYFDIAKNTMAPNIDIYMTPGSCIEPRRVSIIVEVIDEEQRAIDSAQLILEGHAAKLYSDQEGRIFIDSIDPGYVSFCVAKAGYDTLLMENVLIQSGNNVHIDATLKKISSNGASDQIRSLYGRIIDGESQEPICKAQIAIVNRSIEAVSNDSGWYSLNIQSEDPIIVKVTHPAYQTRLSQRIAFKSENRATYDFVMYKDNAVQMQKITVTTTAAENTTAQLFVERKRDFNVSDAIGRDEMASSSSSTAHDAVKRVTGVTTYGGKYVVIRGLGDRYANTLMNGAPLPSPNPDKPSVTFDLFPTGMLNNIKVIKSFSPDQYGNFSGGSIDIATRTYPEKLSASVAFGGGANSYTTFRSDYLIAEEGAFDWIGFDDGTRGLPDILDGKDIDCPKYNSWIRKPPDTAAAMVNQADHIAKAFSTPYSPHYTYAGPDKSLSFSLGNSSRLKNGSIGFYSGLSYSDKYRTLAEAEQSRWSLEASALADSLTDKVVWNEERSSREVLWGAFLTSGISLNKVFDIDGIYLYTRNAEQSSQYLISESHEQLALDSSSMHHREIRYVERGIHFGVVQIHTELNKFDVRLHFSGASSIQNEPDYRTASTITTIFDGDTTYDFILAAGDRPAHRFRYTKENTREGKADLTIPLDVGFTESMKVKSGVARFTKTRNFWQRRFALETHGASASFDSMNGDLNSFTAPENMGLLRVDSSISTNAKYKVGNMMTWDSTSDLDAGHSGLQTTTGAYLMGILHIGQSAITGGIRYENIRMDVNNGRGDRAKFIEDMILPSLSYKYEFFRDMNARFTYGRTYAQPMFREMAPYESYDVAQKELLIGNSELKIARIHNFDIRGEWFFNPGDIIAVSGFYKQIESPIFKVYFPGAENGESTWRNESNPARIKGMEFEIRKQMDFLAKPFSDLVTSVNVTILHTATEVDSAKKAYLQASNSDVFDEQPITYASPYVVNASISYDNQKLGIASGLFFNIFGKRLTYVTIDNTPNAYEFPQAKLDFIIKKKIGKNISVKLAAKNLLNARNITGMEYEGKRYTRTGSLSGRSISLSAAYNLGK